MQFNVSVPIDDLKEKLSSIVNYERSIKMSQTITFDGNEYDADVQSFVNLISTLLVILLGMTLPTPFYWRDANNNNVEHTSTSLTGLAFAMWGKMYPIYLNSWSLKDQIKDSENPSSVNINGGW